VQALRSRSSVVELMQGAKRVVVPDGVPKKNVCDILFLSSEKTKKKTTFQTKIAQKINKNTEKLLTFQKNSI